MPVLASVEGEAAAILAESGAAVVVPPEDVDALVEAARRLADDPARCTALGARGRPYVAAHFDRDALGERYLGILAGATGAGRANGSV